MHAINQIIKLGGLERVNCKRLLYCLRQHIKEFGPYDTEAPITISFCSTMKNCKSDSMTIMSIVEHIFKVHWCKSVNRL